jgi:hypothetical protein
MFNRSLEKGVYENASFVNEYHFTEIIKNTLLKIIHFVHDLNFTENIKNYLNKNLFLSLFHKHIS